MDKRFEFCRKKRYNKKMKKKWTPSAWNLFDLGELALRYETISEGASKEDQVEFWSVIGPQVEVNPHEWLGDRWMNNGGYATLKSWMQEEPAIDWDAFWGNIQDDKIRGDWLQRWGKKLINSKHLEEAECGLKIWRQWKRIANQGGWNSLKDQEWDALESKLWVHQKWKDLKWEDLNVNNRILSLDPLVSSEIVRSLKIRAQEVEDVSLEFFWKRVQTQRVEERKRTKRRSSGITDTYDLMYRNWIEGNLRGTDLLALKEITDPEDWIHYERLLVQARGTAHWGFIEGFDQWMGWKPRAEKQDLMWCQRTTTAKQWREGWDPIWRVAIARLLESENGYRDWKDWSESIDSREEKKLNCWSEVSEYLQEGVKKSPRHEVSDLRGMLWTPIEIGWYYQNEAWMDHWKHHRPKQYEAFWNSATDVEDVFPVLTRCFESMDLQNKKPRQDYVMMWNGSNIELMDQEQIAWDHWIFAMTQRSNLNWGGWRKAYEPLRQVVNIPKSLWRWIHHPKLEIAHCVESNASVQESGMSRIGSTSENETKQELSHAIREVLPRWEAKMQQDLFREIIAKKTASENDDLKQAFEERKGLRL